MQSTSSGNDGPSPTDEARPCEVPESAEPPTITKKSFWGKAKETLADASTHAASASGSLASKAAALGTTSATKTAEVSKQTLAAAGGVARGAVETSKQAYTGSKLQSAINYIDGELDQRGAKKAIKDTAGAVAGKLDQVTGKRLVELLEAKLQMQDSYNDVLATRLAEALERLSVLEAQVSNLKKAAEEHHEHR